MRQPGDGVTGGSRTHTPLGHRFSACCVCHSATVTWCGAWGSNPPVPACGAGALPESELRERWGSRESNTERAPYQRAQVTVPSYPAIMIGKSAGGGSRTHTVPLLRRRPPAIGLHRRGTGPGDRTLRGRFVTPMRSPARSSRVASYVVWVEGFEPTISGSRSRRSTRLSHTQRVATEGVEPSRTAL